jgi:hypothetical protein
MLTARHIQTQALHPLRTASCLCMQPSCCMLCRWCKPLRVLEMPGWPAARTLVLPTARRFMVHGLEQLWSPAAHPQRFSQVQQA